LFGDVALHEYRKIGLESSLEISACMASLEALGSIDHELCFGDHLPEEKGVHGLSVQLCFKDRKCHYEVNTVFTMTEVGPILIGVGCLIKSGSERTVEGWVVKDGMIQERIGDTRYG